MIRCLPLLLVFLCFPFGASALSAADTRHLLERVAFGLQPGDVKRFEKLSREQAVDLLLAESSQVEPANFPLASARPWEMDYWQRPPVNSNWRKQRSEDWGALHAWYFDRVLRTRTPLRERMVLFWHAHYANADIDVAPMMAWQDQTFREKALGNYVELLRAFSRDSANMRNLNLFTNRRQHINENFGRELLELYSIGIGQYREADIYEVSRAFTGWRTWRAGGIFVKWYPWHDFGEKAVLGHTGRFDGDDVIDLLASHPRFAEFLVEKLWREFVSPNPDPAEVQRLSASFRRDYRVDGLLRALLTSPSFWAPGNRFVLVKSPVELVVGALREMGLPQTPGSFGPEIGVWCSAMGQNMFLAPDVKGWRGHTDWLSVATLPVRYQFLHGLREGFDPAMLDRLAGVLNLNEMNSMYRDEDFRRDTSALWMRIERVGTMGGANTSAMASPRFVDLTYNLR
ncbi:DUF1800 family protein [Solimonas sp. SE-A11]|uniref:DUF1800 domain-containing protein n=1 Tax=Solimonas sp. SE-A11 TaxID=3054954 RepID=UPI00259C724E|nr:DUF1800 domain-containing protein [Solimonas sp. SE-A11]MDM4770771.1 DUF1800 domain-containing protein [Solimonas sp. SE-A11]